MNDKRQVYNPFLPLYEYIPDGEPHVFGDRVYIYGSHDCEGGWTFCMLDYTVWSAPVNDLTDWRCEGVSYRASQDPAYPRRKYMYAPDVVRGNDGRYYLYYCMSGDYGEGGYTEPISVAVSDSPAGPYEYIGHVRNEDGTDMMRYVCFDPAVMNDNGVIRLCYGTQYDFEEREDYSPDEGWFMGAMMSMFGRTKEEIMSYPDSIMGPVTVTLKDDMLTIAEPPHHIIPYRVKGTSFEEHPFFEASSLRKVGDKYYFVYSSMQNHELCYATSDKPDRDFTFGGTIVSNGDIGYNGNTKRMNMTGTTHGSIECINGKWYVFYHRLTHKSDYSRQACAQEIEIADDGSIAQVEMTSCGLNGGPLVASGTYPAPIACNITDGNMPHGCNSIYKRAFPNVTNAGDERFIGEVGNGTLIGFKYFAFDGKYTFTVTARTETDANRVVSDAPEREDTRGETDVTQIDDYDGAPCIEVRFAQDGDPVAVIELDETQSEWKEYSAALGAVHGTHPLFLTYRGKKRIQVKEIGFIPVK
ncbi:MAG: family 43 glycosylhydrolase [Lachnospiraceae bacterium]|nr:family 43 glycosylhydrolase [Lachnospiraceae bacterium]